MFYSNLLIGVSQNMIRNARHRVFLSSLYIGHEDVELVSTRMITVSYHRDRALD